MVSSRVSLLTLNVYGVFNSIQQGVGLGRKVDYDDEVGMKRYITLHIYPKENII